MWLDNRATETHVNFSQQLILKTNVTFKVQAMLRRDVLPNIAILIWFLIWMVRFRYGDILSLRWRHNERDGVSNHQPHDCLLNRLIRCRSKKTSKLRVTGLCAGNSPVTGEFPAQMASNAENVSIWWRHHGSPVKEIPEWIWETSG